MSSTGPRPRANAQTETRARKAPVSRGDIVFLAIVLAAAGVLISAFPGQSSDVVAHSKSFLLEMVTILPAVAVVMGLFSVFVSQEVIVRYLGSGSGVRGFLLAVGLGSLPTGPLYVAFPLVRAMRAKGAGTANMVGFLTAWASIKLPQEIVELRFLGLRFTVTRLALTLAAAAAMGMIAERVLPNHLPQKQQSDEYATEEL